MPFAEDQRLNYASPMDPSAQAQAQRDYLNLINQGTERNLGQIQDVGRSMSDYETKKYGALGELPKQALDQYGKSYDQSSKQVKDKQNFAQQAAENTEYAKGAEDAQRKRDILQQKNSRGMSLEEEAIRNELDAGTQNRLMTGLKMRQMSTELENQGQETAYQRAVRGYKGALDPKTHQLDPNAVAAIDRRLGANLPPDQLAAAKAEALRIDPAQQVQAQLLKDNTPEGQALRQTKTKSQDARLAIENAEKAYNAYASRKNPVLDDQQAADARERFAKSLEALGENETAAAVRQNVASRTIAGGGHYQSVDDIMRRGIADLAEKVQGDMQASAPSLGQYANDPELTQTYQALEAKKKKYGGNTPNTYSPASGQRTQTAGPAASPWGAGPGGQPIGMGAPQTAPVNNMQQPGTFNPDSFNPAGGKK